MEELIEEIHDLLENKQLSKIQERLADMQAVDIAELAEELEPKEELVTFRLLDKDTAAEVFAYMDSEYQERLIQLMTDRELETVVTRLYSDDAADLIEEMPANLVKRILKSAPSDKRAQINNLLQFPPESAGSIMTVEFVDLRETMTVRQAFDHIRSTGTKKETIYTCYVLDEKRHLKGAVSAKELLLADQEEILSNLMEDNIISCNTMEDQETVSQRLVKYDLLALPVVDSEERMVGIITVDDAIDILQEESDEDFAIMNAMAPAEDGYFQTSIWSHARRRIGWLLVLMLSATITGTIITKYEAAFSAVPLLVAFIPMLMDTGGNCGAQSSTLVIRGLATGEISLRDALKVMIREICIALLVGVALAIVNGVRIYLQYRDFQIALVIGVTLMCTVLLAKIVGCLLPMLAKAAKMDPAIMAAPLITTLVDTFAVFVYFRTASMILGI